MMDLGSQGAASETLTQTGRCSPASTCRPSRQGHRSIPQRLYSLGALTDATGRAGRGATPWRSPTGTLREDPAPHGANPTSRCREAVC